MFIVRFIRRDRHPNEEYYYNTIEEARWHLNLFCEDDSGLYACIEIADINAREAIIVAAAPCWREIDELICQ